MKTNQSFLKHAVVYGMASLLTSAGNFLLTPFFTRWLNREQYGKLEILGRAAEFIGIFILVTGLRQGLMTLYQQKEASRERRRTVGAALALAFGAALLVGAVMIVNAQVFGGWLKEDPRLLSLAVVAILLEPLHQLPLALMQARLESTRFVVITVSHFLARVVLSIVFVTGLGWGVGGVLGATAISGASFAAILVTRELGLGVAWPDWRRMRGLLRFALPLLPASLCFFVLQNGDRFVLKAFHGHDEVAVYSLGYKLAQAVGTFSLVPLYMVWGAQLYAAARKKDAPIVFGRAFTRILAVFLFVGLGVSMFESEAITILGAGAYTAAIPVIAPVLLGSFFQSAASLMDSAFYVRHRTGQKLGITIASTLLMATLYALWIPRYGSMGAALATLSGFAFLAVCTWVATQRIFPVVYEWRRLVGVVAVSVVFWLLSRPLPATAWIMPVKAGLWFAWPLLLWHLGLVSEEEKSYARSLFRRPLTDRADTAINTGPLGGAARSPRTRSYAALEHRQRDGETRMDAGYLGGTLRHGGGPVAGDEVWRSPMSDNRLSLQAHGECARLWVWDSLALLIRGYVREANADGALDLDRVAESLHCQYVENNDLAVDGLEGSFTVALLDGKTGHVILYRNLVGAGFTYYHAGRLGFLFGSNLAELVETSGVTPRENLLALPTYFLYRFVPGAETLFDGFFRLLPGEQVTWDGRTITRRQRRTFADLATKPITSDPVEALEETMGRVLRDCFAHRPDTVNLLSGGVDSSYLQAIWTGVAGPAPRQSYSISVDHPRSRPDTEYAMTAARALGTEHTLVPADLPYEDYLLDLLASTGEPPNHVQSAYFGHLARTMCRQGITTGLCGEGADSLFGLGLANQIHNARIIRALTPFGVFRKAAATLSDLFGFDRLATTCRLAANLDDFTDLNHPVNRVASFADWPAVIKCFGKGAVIDAAAGRGALLDRLAVSKDPLDRLHAAGYLGEAVDSASLWTTLFNAAGADLLCPFLDSRMLRLALNLPRNVRYRFRKPKDLLKRALARHVGEPMANRPKLGFGQPIFEWLAPGGQLRRSVERLRRYEFVAPAVLQNSLEKPNWFLYSLLCYDRWHRLFIEKSLARPTAVYPQRAVA